MMTGLNLHGKANHHHEKEEDDEGASLSDPVRYVRHNHGKNGRYNINWNRHQLRRARLVAKVVDNTGQEEADSVERAHNLANLLASKPSPSTTVTLTPQ